jgi:hypothetical protein
VNVAVTMFTPSPSLADHCARLGIVLLGPISEGEAARLTEATALPALDALEELMMMAPRCDASDRSSEDRPSWNSSDTLPAFPLHEGISFAPGTESRVIHMRVPDRHNEGTIAGTIAGTAERVRGVLLCGPTRSHLLQYQHMLGAGAAAMLSFLTRPRLVPGGGEELSYLEIYIFMYL